MWQTKKNLSFVLCVVFGAMPLLRVWFLVGTIFEEKGSDIIVVAIVRDET